MDEKHKGTKEYIAVLRLIERYSIGRVAEAIEKSLRFRHPVRDVILQYCIGQEHPEALTFNLAGREHLQGIWVAPPKLNGYRDLTGQEVVA